MSQYKWLGKESGVEYVFNKSPYGFLIIIHFCLKSGSMHPTLDTERLIFGSRLATTWLYDPERFPDSPWHFLIRRLPALPRWSSG